MSSKQQHKAVLGTHWGDEGKGKIVDVLDADVVVRFGGGGNAGHTVKIDDEEYILHLLPSGAVSGRQCVIANGVVTNNDRLLEEIDELNERNKPITTQNLYISDRAHIVTPYHLLLDLAIEIAKSRESGGAVGTTMQGIGPAYAAKAERTGFRMTELIKGSTKALEERINNHADMITRRIEGMGIKPIEVLNAMNSSDDAKEMTKGFRFYFDDNTYVNEDKVVAAMMEHRERLAPFVTDTAVFLEDQHSKGKKIMFEGAQGTFLDLDHGTYPHVTSSTTTIGGVYEGTGICLPIERRIGIIKAYTTRVGGGLFPTELTDETGKILQEMGKEYGATTGRPRRCGWFDGFMGKISKRINGLNEFAITKLDVLDHLDEIKICVGYRSGSSVLSGFPADQTQLASVTPVYETFRGWKRDTTKVTKFEDLPNKAQDYVNFIEKYLGAKVSYISLGKERKKVIMR